jgi:polyisoprenoid-binding protein YceI
MLLRSAFCLTLMAALPLAAQERAIDTARSSITVHVGKAGLLSAAAHEHWVSARIAFGSIDETALRVEFKVRSAGLIIKPDPKVDAKTRAQIQKDMDEMTLEIAKYPEIAFRSTNVSPSGAGQFNVDGSLALHGVSKTVSVTVKREGESFTGHTVIKQTDFGIKPISIAGGTIRIKDPVDIDFEVFPK